MNILICIETDDHLFSSSVPMNVVKEIAELPATQIYNEVIKFALPESINLFDEDVDTDPMRDDSDLQYDATGNDPESDTKFKAALIEYLHDQE